MRFRIRSSGRDESADQGRLASIERAIRSAVESAELEKSGFERRVREARHRVSSLIGSEPFEYLEREGETERDLVASEREFAAAEKRLQQLSRHIDHLRQVLEVLKREPEPTPPST